MSKKQIWTTLVMIQFLFHFRSAAAETKLLRYPDIHEDKIVFTYGGNIYISSIEGKNVKQLTSYPGDEIMPRFSPDGKQIAFTAEFEGNTDVYVMSVQGGKPKRLTFHQTQDLVVDWHPDGQKILFRSIRSSFNHRFNRLHEVPVQGGLPKVLELPEAEVSSYNQTGDKIAFCRTSLEKMPPFKGYHGGMVPNIWTYDFGNRNAELVIADSSINNHPMWIGDSIYFVSDRGNNKEQNLWVYNIRNKHVRQITFFDEWGVEWPSKGSDKIIYENGGSLYIYDVTSGKNNSLNIRISLPENHLAGEVKNVKDMLSGYTISPDGKKVILSARGELFSIDVEKKITRNLTQTSGIKEASPKWSPDGTFYIYVSDHSGEEQIYLQEMNNSKNARQITDCVNTRFGNLSWSPDNTKIGYSDQRSTYYILDIAKKETKKIFFDRYGDEYFVSAAWSPDSKWVVYSSHGSNGLGSIYLFSIGDEKRVRVTDDYTNDFDPQFDPEGQYLYWVSDQNINIEHTTDSEFIPYLKNPSKIICATLTNNILPPFLPEKETGRKQSEQIRTFQIDIEGLGARIVALPIDDSNYRSLRPLKGRIIYTSEPNNENAAIKMYDLSANKEYVLIQDASQCMVADDADKIMVRAGGKIGILDLKPDQKVEDAQMDLSGLNMSINYREEWKQIFNEAWRTQRQFFFDEHLRGIDWKAVKRKYEALLPHVAQRNDLNYLIERMFGELGYSHTEVMGGDFPEIRKEKNGVLGVDLEWDKRNKFYRITKMYRGQNWNPDRISPLTLPGLHIKEGDYLLSIDGTVLEEGVNPYSLLVNKADSTVILSINSKPTFKDSRTVHVKSVSVPESGDNFLRYNDWVWENIEKVNKETDGKVGYIHITDTYLDGLEAFFRYYYPQIHKQALIVDVRFNSGGYIPTHMIERMNGTLYFAMQLPYGRVAPTVFQGPKICIANEWAESGGDMFVSVFQQSNSGLVIGKRTCGTLAAAQGRRLIDGGVAVFPNMGRIMDHTRQAAIENIGVSPDVEVDNRPDEMIQGKDMQLERSIQEIMKKL